jgi:hypothetical protein
MVTDYKVPWASESKTFNSPAALPQQKTTDRRAREHGEKKIIVVCP